MTTNRRTDINLNVGADITNAMDRLRRVQREAVETQRRVDRASGSSQVTGGGRRRTWLPRGEATSTRGRITGGILTGAAVIGAGLGFQAGISVLDQFVDPIIELFQETEIFKTFTKALEDVVAALSPLVGVILQGLTPILKKLEPLFAELALALAPVLEPLLVAVGDLIAAIVPILIPTLVGLSKILTFLAIVIQHLISALTFSFRQIDLGITSSPTASFSRASSQLATTRAAKEAEENKSTINNKVETRVVIDGQIIETTALRRRRLNADYGVGVN